MNLEGRRRLLPFGTVVVGAHPWALGSGAPAHRVCRTRPAGDLHKLGGGSHGVGGSHIEGQKMGWGTGVLKHRKEDRCRGRATSLGLLGVRGCGCSEACVGKYMSSLQKYKKVTL